ncbi:MAG TPA: hypothetical protein VMT19_06155 [Thermoanaerobaculaceae bacterium]|nr:hypothetical protein [Thermoanaerobaculaceae bacterium]
MSTPDLVGQLEHWLAELARKWERYFAGDRQVPLPPERERAALERRLQELSRTEGRSASEKFRMEQLLHRFSTFNQLWQRMLRDKEDARARLGAARRAPNETARQPVPDGSEGYRAVFESYVDALRRVGKDAPVDVDRFGRTLREQQRQLESRGSTVEGFEVVEEDGNVRVRARVRRGRQE